MVKKWKSVDGFIVGLVGLVLSIDLAITLVAITGRMPPPLETAGLLFQEQIGMPLGPLTLAATPFQLAYCVLSVTLVCLAILVCLANYIFRIRSI